MEPVELLILTGLVLFLALGEFVFSTFENKWLIYLLPATFVLLSVFDILYFYQFAMTPDMTTWDKVSNVAQLIVFSNIPTVLLTLEGRWLLKKRAARNPKLQQPMKKRK